MAVERVDVDRHAVGHRRAARPLASRRRSRAPGGGVGVELLDQRGAVLQHRLLVDRSLVGDLARVERRRLVEQDGAGDERRAAGALRAPASSSTSLEAARRPPGGATHVAGRRVGAAAPASSRHAARFGKISAPTKSRSWPAITTSCASRRPARGSCARSGPTLTQVPVDSLKSSASRPSKTSPLPRIAGIDEAHRVAEPVEALLVERGRASAPSSPPVARA